MNFILKHTGDKAEEVISLLPKEKLTTSIVQPAIEKFLYPALLKALKAEIEVYKSLLKTKNKEAKEELKTFDPRHNNTCFVGKGFEYNSNITSASLAAYRKGIGTIKHPVWGQVTLLEIWGGDHFLSHKEMVRGVFKYAFGINKNLPTLKFYVNPLSQNELTGRRTLTKEEKEEEEYLEELYAKAIVFGVRDKPRKR